MLLRSVWENARKAATLDKLIFLIPRHYGTDNATVDSGTVRPRPVIRAPDGDSEAVQAETRRLSLQAPLLTSRLPS